MFQKSVLSDCISMCFGICTINICVSIRVRGLHLVFTHKDDCTQEPYTGELLHTRTSTQRSFYTEKSLYRGVFTPRRVDTQKLLHADAFTQKKYTQKLVRTGACTQSRFYTEQLLHREVFTQRRSMATQKVSPTTHKRVYTQKLVHREAFTQRVFYTQKLLCTEAFTHIFAHRNFYAEELLRTEAFTHREVLTQTKLCDVARPQFHPSFCRLTFMSCEMVASAISKSHFYDSDLEIALLRQFFPFDFHFVRNGCAYDFKTAISLSFWRSAIISRERAMCRATKNLTTRLCVQHARSPQRVAPAREKFDFTIHHTCASGPHDLRTPDLIEFACHHPFVPPTRAGSPQSLTKTHSHFTTRLGVWHARFPQRGACPQDKPALHHTVVPPAHTMSAAPAPEKREFRRTWAV